MNAEPWRTMVYVAIALGGALVALGYAVGYEVGRARNEARHKIPDEITTTRLYHD